MSNNLRMTKNQHVKPLRKYTDGKGGGGVNTILQVMTSKHEDYCLNYHFLLFTFEIAIFCAAYLTKT